MITQVRKPTLRTVKLGGICRFINGGTPDKSIGEYFEGTIPWITSADITSCVVANGRSLITETAIENSATNLVPAGTILLVTRTGVGKVAIAGCALCFSQDITALIHDPDRIDARYLARYLETKRAHFEQLARGATIKGITRAVVENLDVPLPDLNEQRRIAGILNEAEKLRSKRSEALALIDSLAQAIFLEMFGDPVRNEKHWPKHSFDLVCPTRLGKMLDQKRNTGHHFRKYLRNANVRWFDFDLTDVFEMDFDDKDRETFRLQEGDVLICEGGEPGRSAVWRGEIGECYYQKALHRGRPNPQMVRGEYLVSLLWFFAKNGGLKDHITSATIAHLTGEKLKAMRIPIPPVELQDEFVVRISKMQELGGKAQTSLRGIEELFASLQHRAFRGEL